MTTISAQDTLFYVKNVDIARSEFTVELTNGDPFCRNVLDLRELPYKLREKVMDGRVKFITVDVHFISSGLISFKNWASVPPIKKPIGELFTSFADE